MLPIFLLTFVSVSLLVWYLAQAAGRGDRAVLERLNRLGAQTDGDPHAHPAETEPVSVIIRIVRVLAHVMPLRRLGSRVDADLARADFPLRGEEFAAGVILAGITGWAAGSLILRTGLGAAVLAVLAAAAPFFALHLAKARRLAAFNAQLGDALAMISNTLRAGFGFAQALEMVCREMPPPISKEFARCLQEMNLGLGTEEALQTLVGRVGSDDLDLMVTAVIIQRQVGGNLAEILDKIRDTIRERVRIKGEIKTLTAQGRISGLIIGLLPVALALVLLLINPGYLRELFGNPAGLAMVAYATVSEVIGVILVRHIMNIEV
ncbi:MAG: type II secretion system F family protein [Thermoanaerobacterales bacterium]|nr:type II secretion system F family protein [Bacillota bacterium]MDI6906290.1 type II secretion system F family protein [Thermoanaerobacterales bacterium]